MGIGLRPMSFAQFEREVTAERLRDKLAASKARGMWMGGTPPLGYEPNGRSLAIVEGDAELIRLIFHLYLNLGNVRLLRDELEDRRISKPRRVTGTGKSFGGKSFTRGELYAILSNPIYIGRIRHRETTYDGLHQSIIDEATWASVQKQLADNRNGENRIATVAHPSPLAGKLFDEAGEKMIATHANKGSRRYRYYVSQPLQRGDSQSGQGMRLPAREIESLVCGKLTELFDDPIELMRQASIAPDASSLAALPGHAAAVASVLRGSASHQHAYHIAQFVARIDVGPSELKMRIDLPKLTAAIGLTAAGSLEAVDMTIPAKLKRSGLAMRLVFESGKAASPRIDDELIDAIASARHWWQQLVDNPQLRIADLALANSVSESWVTRILRLAFVDPTIIERVLAGQAPASFTRQALRATAAVPEMWADQRALHRISATI